MSPSKYRIISASNDGAVTILSGKTKYLYAGATARDMELLNRYEKYSQFGKGWQLIKRLRLIHKQEAS